ncbi:flagellar hook-length control protein FliK [Pseudoduganella lutea]|uniref:Flagellar hook-length control protein FliK n=1 Tax=Pseudoduganella lutea TaxID=321985 RepID=A0A4P6L2Y1_9BURK|nr:flagellar hook-length control protein FliK [Pseudoduganella lutea]QBE65645.1 flagellar hook-length control protein FliK [Pseudoduganella lutea]
MMITTPSAPGGAAAAQNALPGVAVGGAPALAAEGANIGGTSAMTEGAALGGTGLPMQFAQLLDFAGLGAPAANAAGQPAGAQAAQPETDAELAAEDLATEAPLAAMMPVLHFAVLPQAAQPAAANATIDATQMRGTTLLAAASNGARQAAADAITNGAAAATAVAATPLAARLLQGALPVTGEPAAPKAAADVRQAVATATAASAGTHAGVQAAQDGTAQSGAEGQPGQQAPSDGQATFRGVMAASAPLAGATAPADTVKLAGTPEQWQQPLRAALGDRLQVTLQKGNDQAVIRLEPPNLGSIEISIRQTAGALHVSMSATNSEVVRQLNAVGDSMRQDLSQRQQGDVAVTVSQASSRSLADSEGRGRQPEREAEQQREQRGPGRALNEGNETNTTFAMQRE